MPEIIGMLKLTLIPSNPECDALIVLMKEHTIQMLNFQKLNREGRQSEYTSEMREIFTKRKEEIHKSFVRCLADNPHVLWDMRWDTDDFLTREEQATLTAPLG